MFFVNYMMVCLFCYEMIIISRGFCTCTAIKAIEQPSVTFVKNIVLLLYFGKILELRKIGEKAIHQLIFAVA